MPQEDQRASELDHAEEVCGVSLPAACEAAEVLQPGEQPFDLPAAQVATQRPSILCFPSPAPIGSDYLDAVQLLEPRIQWVAVVGFVADQSLGDGGDMSLCKCAFDQRGLIR